MAGVGGRQAKPVQLQLLQGNPNHLTKLEIETRQKNEIRFGDHNFVPTPRVEKNPIAYAKWQELVNLYIDGNIEFVSTADAGLLERYCLTHADYMELSDQKEAAIAEFKKGKLKASTIMNALNKLQINNQINRKIDLLLKMDMQLILTPLSKLKNVNRTPAEESEEPLKKAGFGNV